MFVIIDEMKGSYHTFINEITRGYWITIKAEKTLDTKLIILQNNKYVYQGLL